MRYFTRLLIALCIPASMIHAADEAKLTPAQQEALDAHKARGRPVKSGITRPGPAS